MSPDLENALILMGKGMLGIFAVIIILTVIVAVMGRAKKNKDEDNDDK